MEIKTKEMYRSPEAKIFEVKTEGVICANVTATMSGTWGEENVE